MYILYDQHCFVSCSMIVRWFWTIR